MMCPSGRTEANAEKCHYSIGSLALDENSEGVGVMGGQAGEEDYNTVLRLFVAGEDNGDFPAEMLNRGDAYFVGGYPWPPVIEVHYHSREAYCGIPT
jgi:hypothetical protein